MDRQVGAGEERRADEERRRGGDVAGDDDLVELKPSCRFDGDGRGAAANARAGRLEHELRVVAGRHRFDDRRHTLGVEARQQDRGLHLRGRNRQHVLDPVERVRSVDRERRASVRRCDARAHSRERLGDAVHRSRAERVVAGEDEGAVLACEDAGQQAQEGSRVAAIDRVAGRAQSPQADSVHDELVVRFLVNRDTERADRVERRLGVARAPELAHARLAVRQCADEERAVGDRLVPGNGYVPDERAGRLDLHSSSTGATTT